MNQLSLQSDLGIEHVAELQAGLLPHLDDETAIELAGDQVERVHAAGLQVLHAFVRDRARASRSTTVVHASPVLADAARSLALAVSLGIESGD